MAIPRLHLFELEDFPWFPSIIRDYATDYLRFMQSRWSLYSPMIVPLSQVLEATGERTLLDLCSGGTGPILDVQKELARRGIAVEVVLTDKYPNLTAFERARASSAGSVSHIADSVDALDVPSSLGGCRTFFNAFHHFRPEDAQGILDDAVACSRPIAIFDVPERRLPMIFMSFITPVIIWITTPLMRPVRWSRFLLTYLIPLVPLLCLWDGIVSMLRAYTVEELDALAQAADPEGSYVWRSGKERATRVPARVTFLIGYPRASRTHAAGLVQTC